MEREVILIGAWLKGEFVEDLDTVDDKDFHYAQVVRLLKDGKSAIEISELADVPIDELMKMTTQTMPLFYKQAIYAYRAEKLKWKFAQGIYSFDEVKEDINRLEGTLDVIQSDCGYAEEYMQELEARAKQELAKWDKLPTLNAMTDGIRRKELTTIAARPSVGKSAFALQMALGVQKLGKKVLYFPLEMSKTQTFDRIIQNLGLADTKTLRSGKIVQEKSYAYALECIDKLEQSGNFKIYEGVSSIEKIENAIKQEKPFLVVIDQLTQLRAKKSFGSIREKFSHMTATLKALAMREDVAIMLLAQVNRDAQNAEPTLANLKESGSIEEDSDNVVLLHRVRQEDMLYPEDWQRETPVLVKLDKHRNGEIGDFISAFVPEKFMFYEKAR